MRWFGIFGAINRFSLGHVPLIAGRVGPVTIADSIYGLVPARDAAPYWASKIQGEFTATDWSDSQSVIAATQARLVASLISLSYDPGIQLVTHPSPDAEATYARFEERTLQQPPGSMSGAVSVIENSWEKLEGGKPEKRELLRGALLMFHEGLLLRDEHPSMALVAFVAAIEAVGQIENPPDPPCSQCGFKKGAHRAFKSALKRAGFEGQWLRVADKTYGDFRSPTVHSAVLHGYEVTSGVQTVKLDASESSAKVAAFTFPAAIEDVGQLWLLEQACKKVLRSYL
jgi:hypothetical protein